MHIVTVRLSSDSLRTPDLMNYETLIKFAPILIGAFAAWKIVVDLLRGRYSHLRDEYRFAREFFNDLSANSAMHPFLRQKGYQALAGDARLTAGEVEYLLALNGSSRALKDYVLGLPYLEHVATAAESQVKFKKKYISDWSRRWRKYFYFGLYLACYFTSFAPLVLPVFRVAPSGQAFPLFVMTAVVFLPAAFFSLKAGVRISRAESLVKNQTIGQGIIPSLKFA